MNEKEATVPECVHLRATFGKLYKIAFDESYDHQHVPRDRLDPWMMQIPCAGKGITIYPHGGTTLAVEVNYRRHLSTRLREMGLTVHQDGDNEQTFLFDVKDFGRVVEVVRPRKRRRLTEEQKAKLAASQTAEERVANLGKARGRKVHLPLREARAS